MTMKPIHIGAINGHAVRFFKTPLNDGKPDFPWLSFDDLLNAFTLPDALKTKFRQDLRRSWGETTRTAPTADGLTTIVPHFAGQGFAGGMDVCFPGVAANRDYHLAVAEAFKLQTARMSFPNEVLAFSAVAMKRWGDAA